MTETDSVLNFEFGSLKLICYLACLREAASAKAGAWDLVLILSPCSIPYALCSMLYALCPIRFDCTPSPQVGLDNLRIILNLDWSTLSNLLPIV